MTEANNPPRAFSVSVEYVKDQAAIAVAGEVDMLTVPELGATLNAAIDLGYQSIVLDLTELDFMDASGLGVIAVGCGRLKRSGGELAIRSPSVMVRRILRMTGLADLVLSEESDLAISHTEAERSVGKLEVSTMYRSTGIDHQLRVIGPIARAGQAAIRGPRLR